MLPLLALCVCMCVYVGQCQSVCLSVCCFSEGRKEHGLAVFGLLGGQDYVTRPILSDMAPLVYPG